MTSRGKPALGTILLFEGGLILYFSVKISQALSLEERTGVTWVLTTGVFFIAVGLLLLTSETFHTWCEDKLLQVGNWLGVHSWQGLLLVTGRIFAIIATNAGGFLIRMHDPYVAVISWLIGIASAICGG